MPAAAATQVPATELIPEYAVGDTMAFGRYGQDNDPSNGQEDISWQVFARDGNRYLLISRSALVCMPYNETSAEVTWKGSSVRMWLNGEFLKTAFTTAEQRLIAEAALETPDNPAFGTDGGLGSMDKVFLLS